jgi:hypothetical protein
MTLTEKYKYLSITALLAGLSLFSMLLISILAPNHITQQYFEIAIPTEFYTQKLIENSGVLRNILTFDNMFVVFYSATFTFLYSVLCHDSFKINVLLGLIAVLMTGILDFYENHHIFSMIHAAEKKMSITDSEILNQMTLSQLKFHLSYLGFFLIGFSLPADTLLEKVLKYSILIAQLPVGVLVYTANSDISSIFGLARYAFMLSGLLLISYNFFSRYKITIRSFTEAV